MRAARSTLAGMLRALLACATCAVAVGFLSDCVTGAKPLNEKCPTSADSATFYGAGSCGQPGEIRIATEPGLCAITVTSLCADAGPCPNVLPVSGNFTGDAVDTHYDLTAGNWSLLGKSSDPSADPSTTTCQATPMAAPGSVLVTCDINACVPSGDDTGFVCSQSTCVMHLNPPSPDAGAPDTGEHDSGKADAGELDSGEADTGEHG